MLFRQKAFSVWVSIALLAAGCQAGGPAPMLLPTAPEATATATLAPSFTPSATSIPATPTATATPAPSPTPEPAVLVGAGDIAVCGTDGSAQTAELVKQIPGAVFTAGDNSNEEGSPLEFSKCFDPTWGQFKERIHPSPGNHDYLTPGASGYFDYFGAAAGQPGQGWYSYDLGAWHVIVLNSNCNDVACGPKSPQVTWLEADLAAHPGRCTLAYWHHPRFSSGIAGSFGMDAFWEALYAAGADVVVNGNDHDYERFAQQDPNGKADPQRGIREFVVGTGGAEQRGFKAILPTSEIHQTGVFGVIQFTLWPDHYDWRFIPVAGASFTDAGSTRCHSAAQ
jgi:hypothetical protein